MFHLRLEALEHARGELVIGARLTVLPYAEGESHAENDEQAFEQPVDRRLPDLGDVRMYFHGAYRTRAPSSLARIRSSVAPQCVKRPEGWRKPPFRIRNSPGLFLDPT